MSTNMYKLTAHQMVQAIHGNAAPEYSGWVVGRGFITFRNGDISEMVRDKINKELGRYLYLAEGQQRSHVWNEGT